MSVVEWFGERPRRLVWLGVAVVAIVGFVLWRIDLRGPPGAFDDRTPQTSCGTVAAAFSEETVAGPEVDCLEDAVREGGDAQLVVRTSTAEGDPVVLYYRTVPGGTGLELFIDGSRDPNNSGFNWTHLRCPEATSPNDPGECVDADPYN